MLIQRSGRPSRTSSTISTFGASGSCGRATTPPRDRAVRRRRGLGRFGTGTSRLVAQHGIRSTKQSTCAVGAIGPRGFQAGGDRWYGGRHIAGHIQRGGGTGPVKPRQPPAAHAARRERCQFLTDVAGGSRSPPPLNRRRFFMGASNLRCRECRAEEALEARHVCERCFGPPQGAYDHGDLAADRDQLRPPTHAGPQNIWRYADFLPLVNQPGPSTRASSRFGLPAGCTPLIRADRLAERLGLGEVWVKNDAANPTHSFKDRVVSVASARARELGYEVLACASTGNLANSVAAHAAALGMPTSGLTPADLEEQKVLATGVYGTHLVKVQGNYDDVNRLCTELSGERDWAFVNVNMRPYYAEGSKTLAYEVAEQLGWRTPDRCVVPIASGSLYTKIAKGFREWLELGLIEGAEPVMNGAQAEGCSPVAGAFAAGADVCRPVRPKTIAKSLAIGNPADGPYALDLARRSGGAIDAVSDDEIRAGIRLLAETTGIFTETAGGTTTAVLAKLAERGEIGRDERVVVVITGEGLKTLDAVRGTFEAYEIAPSYDEFTAKVEAAEVRA